ncbi:hypothetical protein CBR_g39873 [Chara braunii]|uniref:Uncharacterized protein n=1 Tax=Chara braunii TaxID=69332 RepID=A0A388LSS3_CHABU|nr:hypothetical protein CBR_g39873 [Chara braunii]|eukprot:GBG85305.1 hypothetical protein CBR_g39873 [Chara braunii]
MGKKLSSLAHSSGDKKKKHCSYENVFDQLLEWSAAHVDELMSTYGSSEQSSAHGGSCGRGSASTVTPRSRGGRPRSNALRWRDDKDGLVDIGPRFERLTMRDRMAMWDAPVKPDVVFLKLVKLLQILGMFEKSCPQHGKEVEVTIKKIRYPSHICKLQFECGKGCSWHWSSAKVVAGGVRDSRVETQLFHSTVAVGMTYTQLNNLLLGPGMKKSFERLIARLRRSNDPIVILVDGRYDSSREAQHCTVSTLDLKFGMIMGTETMVRGGESSWRLETQCVEKLLYLLKDEKNLIIVEVVHDDCGAIDVILQRMNIDSQKCMRQKAKTLVKRLREAVRAAKTAKPSVVGACEHVREVKYFTKRELKVWLDTKGVCVRVRGVATKKKDELVEIVWGVLFPNEAGKPLPDDVIEIDALEALHCSAAEEAKEWLYGTCRISEPVGDDDDDVLASHGKRLANHWAKDHSL